MTEPLALPAPLEFRFNRDDFAALSRITPAIPGTKLLGGFVTAVNAGGIAYVAETIVDTRIGSSLLMVLAVLGFWAIGRALGARAVDWAFKANPMTGKDIVVEFLPDKLVDRAGGLRVEVDWGEIARLVETRTHLFLRLSPQMIVILPRRAFASPEDYRATHDFIAARVAAAAQSAKT